MLALPSEGVAGDPEADLGSRTGKQLPSPSGVAGPPPGDTEVGTAHESRHRVRSLPSGEVGLQTTCAACSSVCRAPGRWQLGEKPDPASSRMDLQGSVCLSGVFLNFLFCIGVHAKSLQSCGTLCNPLDCNPPGFSVHGIFQ